MTDEKLANYLSGNATSQEIREVEEWLNADPGNPEYLKQIKQAWDQLDSLKDYNSLDLDNDWKIIRERIGFAGKQGRTIDINKFRSGIYPFLRVAAILVIILTGAGLLELKFDFISVGSGEMIAYSSTEGKMDVTLSDGTVVFLN